MNAWSPGPFDNDDASDFVADLARYEFASDVGLELSAELAGCGRVGHIGVRELNRALAAAALVAVLAGANEKVPFAFGGGWAARNRLMATDVLKARAANVIARAFNPQDNDWYAFWEQAGKIDEARASIAGYAAALS